MQSSNRITQTLSTHGLGSVILNELKNKAGYALVGDDKSAACKNRKHTNCFKLNCACNCHREEQE